MSDSIIFKTEVKSDLEAHAAKMGITVSQLMRQITKSFLEQEEKNKPKTKNSLKYFGILDESEDVNKTIQDFNEYRKSSGRNLNF